MWGVVGEWCVGAVMRALVEIVRLSLLQLTDVLRQCTPDPLRHSPHLTLSPPSLCSGPGLVCFGPDRVADFCERNGLQLMIRAHECVMDGFERFAQGKLITLFR